MYYSITTTVSEHPILLLGFAPFLNLMTEQAKRSTLCCYWWRSILNGSSHLTVLNFIRDTSSLLSPHLRKQKHYVGSQLLPTSGLFFTSVALKLFQSETLFMWIKKFSLPVYKNYLKWDKFKKNNYFDPQPQVCNTLLNYMFVILMWAFLSNLPVQ